MLAQQTETASSVLLQSEQASGGSAWANVRTLHIQSETLDGGVAGTQDEWDDVLTGRYAIRSVNPQVEEADGFDGVSVWTQGSGGYSYVLGGEDAHQGAIDQAYQISCAFWFLQRNNATLALEPNQQERGRVFDVIEITPQAGRSFTVWIDRATHLIDRFVEQQAEDIHIVQFQDYRTVSGGIKLPFTIRTGDGDDRWDEVDHVQSVMVNPPLASSQFALPKNRAPDYQFPKGKSSVTVPFRLSDDKILFPVKIDGQGPFDAELDTGGHYIIQPALAQQLKLYARGAYKEGGGGESFISVGWAIVDGVDIGGLHLAKQPYKIFSFDDDPQRTLAGVQLLQRFVISLNFDRGLMTLTRSDRYAYRGTGVSLPFHFQDNQPEIDGAVDGISGVFTIDTGDDDSLLLIAPFAARYSLVQRYGATIPYGGGAVGGATHGLMTRAGELDLFGADGRPAVTTYEPLTRLSQQQRGFDADRYVSGNIGIGILKQFNLVFDYARQRIIFEKNRSYGQKDVYNRTGLQLQRSGTMWLVSYVAANSPASELGIKPGDTVFSVNNRNASQITSDDLYYLFRRAVGTRITLVVQSGESRRTVELGLHDVL